MDTVNQHMYIHESQALSPIKSQQPSNMPVSENGFPILAIAVLGIMATAFLLVSYYIFVTKCCFNCQQIDPLRRFIGRARQQEDPLVAYSPSWQSRGLDELLIRQLPTFQYTKTEGQERNMSKCVVCLNEFQDQDMLRFLPKCSHVFHLDCIDIWLQSNTNCPLCRSSISGRNRYRMDRIIAPNSSPQDPQPYIESLTRNYEDFVVIDFTGQDGSGSFQQRQDHQYRIDDSRSHSSIKTEQKPGKMKSRKFHHVSIMGDECLNVRDKDDQFSIQPIRRSFSMDSVADRHVYLSVQEIIRQNRLPSEVSNNEDSSNGVRRSIFSFGHGRGSRSAVLPYEF